jgi:hypothetical protein
VSVSNGTQVGFDVTLRCELVEDLAVTDLETTGYTEYNATHNCTFSNRLAVSRYVSLSRRCAKLA